MGKNIRKVFYVDYPVKEWSLDGCGHIAAFKILDENDLSLRVRLLTDVDVARLTPLQRRMVEKNEYIPKAGDDFIIANFYRGQQLIIYLNSCHFAPSYVGEMEQDIGKDIFRGVICSYKR